MIQQDDKNEWNMRLNMYFGGLYGRRIIFENVYRVYSNSFA